LGDEVIDELLLTIVPQIEPDPQQPPITELPGEFDPFARRQHTRGSTTSYGSTGSASTSCSTACESCCLTRSSRRATASTP
jgi:hypothetical protein